jgi:putative FmdB family regulatory protein
MPIYEYECAECGVHFDKMQRFGDPAPDACPNGHKQVHRLFSQPTIIFKGKGFYVTDNGRNGRRSPTQKKDSGAKSSAPVSAKADTEPGGTDKPGAADKPSPVEAG